MPDETRDEKYSRQTSENFAALGRFVQEFELLVSSVRTSCVFLLGCNNSPKHQQLVNVILCHQSLTAGPLFQIMRGLYAAHIREFPEHVRDDNQDVILKVLAYCATQYDDLANKRNNLLHGTWFIGFANGEQEDFSELQVHKFCVTKNGCEPAKLPKSAAELSKLTDECQELRELISRISVTFHISSGSRVAKNVRLENKRWLPEPPLANT
jgi:hypothetical protein